MGKVVLTLAVTTAGLGLLSLHLVNLLREGDAAIAELKTQVASLQEQVAQRPLTPTFVPHPPAIAGITELPPAATQEAPKTAPPQVAATVASAIPRPLSHEDRVRMMREQRERQRQLMQDPEYRDAIRLQSRTNLARQYPGVIQELNLDPLQADEFFGMLADQQMRVSEQMEPMWFADDAGTPDSAAFQERQRKIQQAVAELQRNNEAELASRFGQGKLQAWKEYQSTVGQRYQLDHMRTTLASQGLPLSDDVNKPMLKALAAAQQAEVNEFAAAAGRGAVPGMGRATASVAFEGHNIEQQIETTKKRNQRTLDAISPYLTFEQREAIEKEQAAQMKMLEAQMRLMQARGNANANGVYTDGNAQFITPQ